MTKVNVHSSQFLVADMEKNRIFTIASIRKSDKKFYLSGNERVNLFTDYTAALNEAIRKARECSKDYVYVVTELTKVTGVQLGEVPVDIVNY